MKTNKGFSLVELIVVIAIMAIIAAVAIPVYNIYIEKAEKANDVSLVGEVLNALDIAINSGTISAPEDSYQLGMGTLPIGFIVINQDGTKIVTSNITVDDSASKTPCEFVEEEITYIQYTSKTLKCTCSAISKEEHTEQCGNVVTGTVKYCKNHSSKLPEVTTTATEYLKDFSISSCGAKFYNSCSLGTINKTMDSIPSGTKLIDNISKLSQPSATNATQCDLAYKATTGSSNPDISGSGDISYVTSGPIYDALVAAFGSLDNIKLTYDGWNSEGEQSHATIYAYAGSLMGDLTGVGKKLVDVTKYAGDGAADALGIEKAYKSTDDMVIQVSGNFQTLFSDDGNAAGSGFDKWLVQWNAAAKEKAGEPGFGFSYKDSPYGRENYYAMRRIYNECLAGYLQSNGITDANSNNAITAIRENSRPITSGNTLIDIAIELYGAEAPYVVNSSTVKNVLPSGISSEMSDKIVKLVAKYEGSEASDANARATYDLMMNVASTNEEAKAYDGGFVEYYNQYVKKVSDFYSQAQAAAGNGIVIVVTVENGVINCNVSPFSANPRYEEKAK